MKKLLCMLIIVLAGMLSIVHTNAFISEIAQSETTSHIRLPYNFDGCFVFREGNLYGLESTSGTIISQAEYDKIGTYYYDSGMFIAKKGKQKGYLNIDGQFISDTRWKEVHDFYEGYAIVDIEDGFQVLDSKLNIISEVYGYKSFRNLVDHGFIEVIDKDNKVGFVDINGTLTMKCQWNENDILPGEGCIAFYDGKLWGLMDSCGKVLISPQFVMSEWPSCERVSFLTTSNTWEVYSTTGEFIFETPQNCSGVYYTDNYAVVTQKNADDQRISDYIYDKHGNMTPSQQEYSIISNFHCDRAEVRFDSGDFGYIDPTGAIICRGYKKTTEYDRNIAIVTDSNGNKLYIDTYGNIISAVIDP